MKKLSVMLIWTISLSLLFCVNVFADNISVYVDNELVQLTDAAGANVYPFIQNGTTYVPLRGISETLDCDVVWDGNNNTILIYKEMQSDNSVFRNNSDEIKLYADNQLVELKDANGTIVKPFIKDGTTYVPLRGVSKVLGYPVEWDGPAKSVYVWKDEVSPNGVTMDFFRPYEIQHSTGWASFNADYESDGGRVEIDGEYYTNVLSGWWGSALFNLDGKYDTLTCVLGPTANLNDEKTVTFIVDGKIVETIVIEPNSFSEEINIDLQKGLQLKIMIDGYVGLGDITFYGE